jgi:hypothetical protein
MYQGCTGAIRRWTPSHELAAGSSTATLDWHWQELDARGAFTKDNDEMLHRVPHELRPGLRLPPTAPFHGGRSADSQRMTATTRAWIFAWTAP